MCLHTYHEAKKEDSSKCWCGHEKTQLSHTVLGSIYFYSYFGKLLVTAKAGSVQ